MSAGADPWVPEPVGTRARKHSPQGRQGLACGADAAQGQARCLPRPPPAAMATKSVAPTTFGCPKASYPSAQPKAVSAAGWAGSPDPSPALGGVAWRAVRLPGLRSAPACCRPAGPIARLPALAAQAPKPRPGAVHRSQESSLPAPERVSALCAAAGRRRGLAGGSRAARNRAAARDLPCLRAAQEPVSPHWLALQHSELPPPPGGRAASC